MTSSMGRVVTSGVLGGKQGLMLHILDYDSCVTWLDEQPPGSSILRIEVKSMNQKKAELQLSYKYKTFIYNHTFPKFVFRVQGNMGVKCKTNAKNYKEIRRLHAEFIPSVRLFITEFVSNHNYTEKELTQLSEIENELLYRKFVIFPLKERVVIKRKVGSDIKTASIGFDFEHMKFFAEEGSKVSDIKSFNEYLISFLEINTSDKLLVRATLGYSRPADVFANGELGNAPVDVRKQQKSETVVVRSKDKDKLVEKLKDEIRSIGAMPQWKMPPGPVRNMLRTILEATTNLQSSFEQMDWISRGILDVLLQVMVLNGNTDIYNEIPIKICKMLLDKNTEGCEIFSQLCFKVIDAEKTWECVGVYHAIVVLIEVNHFREVFVKILGPSRLLQVYVRASYTLVGEQRPVMGDVNTNTATALSDSTSTSPREYDFDDAIEFESPDELMHDIEVSLAQEDHLDHADAQEPEEMTSPSSARGAAVLIPKLSLPSTAQQGSLSRRGRKTVVEEQFQRTASEEMDALAKNLGETYMTQDLTALLSYLQDDSESVKSRKHNRVTVNLATTSIFAEDDMMPLAPKVLGFRNSCYYKIKCSILNIFARLTKHWQYFDFIVNPVNLLFSELLVSYRDYLLLYDDDFRLLIYNVLNNYAHYVEYMHNMCWKKSTEGMSLERMKRLRTKLDKFIWRVVHRLLPSVEAKDYFELEIFLTLLVEYMRNCPTRVMASQVAAVTMEHLLVAKDLVLQRGRITPQTVHFVGLYHQMLSLFDELATQNTHGPMNEFMLALMLESDEFRHLTKHYTGQILFNKTIEKFITGVPRTSQGKQKLKSYRCQVIRHFTVCYSLFKQQVEFYEKEEAKNVPFSKAAKESTLEYAHDFDFMLNPVKGYVLQLLTETKGLLERSGLQKECLRFLIVVFSDKNCWYSGRKAYVDAYLSYSYLTFIKLYHTVSYDDDTMELMQLHLQLLLAFSQNKNEKIRLKFYQLRVLDFLVREVNLEYEVTQSQERILIANSTDEEEVVEVEAVPKPDPTISVPVWSAEDSKFKKGRGSRIRHAPYKLLSKSKAKKAEKKSKLSEATHPASTSPDSAKEEESALSSREESEADGSGGLSEGAVPVTPLGQFLSNVSDEKEGKKARPIPLKLANQPPKMRKSTGGLVIPGLSLDATTSFDGQAKKGSDSVAGLRESTDEESDTPTESESEYESSSGESVPPSSTDDEYDDDGSGSDSGQSGFTSPKSAMSLALSAAALAKQPVRSNEPSMSVDESKTEASADASASEEGPEETTVVDEEEEEEEESSSYYSSSSEQKPSLPGLSLNLSSFAKAAPKVAISMPKLENVPMKGGASMPKLKLTDDVSKSDIAAATQDLNAQGASSKVGVLSSLENKIDKNDPKFQLIFDNKEKREETQKKNVRNLNDQDVQEMTQLYLKERNEHKIYAETGFHVLVLRLIFSLMLTPTGTLDSLYCDQFPLDNKKLNIPFLLRCHLSHPANRNVLPVLCDAVHKDGRDAFRLLKLLCPRLFRKEMFNDLHRLAIGAYGTVYRCRLKPDCQTMDVAIKLMEVPKSIHDRCVLHDIFDEIVILDRFAHDSRISKTYDFGTDDDYYWITMKRYKCSLKHWRKKQTKPLSENLALYLNIYMNLLNTFQFLSESKVNHFDVKCDNFLIQPLNEAMWSMEDEENFWHPQSDLPNFSVCLADFGESKIFDHELDGYTTRNRGTEFTKSPEMLAVAYASQKTRNTYDRRKKVGASAPADIWALGCLLYELLTGEFLFYDQDWVRFFIRVTSPGQELITAEKMEKIGNNKVLLEFLNFILCRDPQYRPSIQDAISRFKYVRGRLTSSSRAAEDLPPEMPSSPTADERKAEEKKAEERKAEEKRAEEKRAEEKKAEEKKAEEKKEEVKEEKKDNPFAKFGVVLRTTKRPLSPKKADDDSETSGSKNRATRGIGGAVARLRRSMEHRDEGSSHPLRDLVRKSLDHKDDSSESRPTSPHAAPNAMSSSDGTAPPLELPTAELANEAPAAEKAGNKAVEEAKESSKPLLLHSISQRKMQMDEEDVRIPLIEQFVDEGSHFLAYPSALNEFLYLGSDLVAVDRDKLRSYGITHIVSCSEVQLPMAFVTMYISFPKGDTSRFMQMMPEFFNFVSEARIKKGRVLICGVDGTANSSAAAAAYLMHSHNWTYFEAFTFIKDRRYVIEPDNHVVKALCDWYRETQKKASVHYQCLCGACAISVTGAFVQTSFPNPRGCACKVGDKAKCPNVGCRDFVEQMNQRYSHRGREVLWGYTKTTLLSGEYTRATVEYNPIKALAIPRALVSRLTPKPWTVFQCSSCDFLTHAILKPDSAEAGHAEFDAAVVTNLTTTGHPFSGMAPGSSR